MMKSLGRQLGTSSQRIITVPRGTTLGVATADTPADLETDLPDVIDILHLGRINQIARNLFRQPATPDGQDTPPTPIGLVLQAIFGQWLTVLDSILTPTGPTWHLIEGPIQVPLRPYQPVRGLGAGEAILGLGVRK